MKYNHDLLMTLFWGTLLVCLVAAGIFWMRLQWDLCMSYFHNVLYCIQHISN